MQARMVRMIHLPADMDFKAFVLQEVLFIIVLCVNDTVILDDPVSHATASRHKHCREQRWQHPMRNGKFLCYLARKLRRLRDQIETRPARKGSRMDVP